MNKPTPPGTANHPIGEIGETEKAQANQEIGEPRGKPSSQPRGESYWHSRGYLPHFESQVAIQHVTFHLADSLPKVALLRIEAELKRLPPEKQEVERRKRIEAWRDAGYGSCILRQPDVAQMMQSTLLFFDSQRYRLLAWVIMPNHVHILFQPLNGWTVAKIVASWKKFTARKICDYQRATPGFANRAIGGKTNQAIGEPSGEPRAKPDPVWQREYWDRYIRNEKHLHQAILYIQENPVKAGLVAAAGDWRWSSTFLEANGANREIGEPGGK
jgi:REP element-mobilizing transposase RayT